MYTTGYKSFSLVQSQSNVILGKVRVQNTLHYLTLMLMYWSWPFHTDYDFHYLHNQLLCQNIAIYTTRLSVKLIPPLFQCCLHSVCSFSFEHVAMYILCSPF